jgi:hypothetical protein
MFQSRRYGDNVGRSSGARRITATPMAKKKKKTQSHTLHGVGSSSSHGSGYSSSLSFSARDSWTGFRRKTLDSIEKEDWLGAFHVAEKALVMSES